MRKYITLFDYLGVFLYQELAAQDVSHVRNAHFTIKPAIAAMHGLHGLVRSGTTLMVTSEKQSKSELTNN